jgi:hypothetical protein
LRKPNSSANARSVIRTDQRSPNMRPILDAGDQGAVEDVAAAVKISSRAVAAA